MTEKENGRVMWTRELERLPVILGDHKIFPEDEPVHIFTESELSALKEAVAREAFAAGCEVQVNADFPIWWAWREKGEGHE